MSSGETKNEQLIYEIFLSSVVTCRKNIGQNLAIENLE